MTLGGKRLICHLQILLAALTRDGSSIAKLSLKKIEHKVVLSTHNFFIIHFQVLLLLFYSLKIILTYVKLIIFYYLLNIRAIKNIIWFLIKKIT